MWKNLSKLALILVALCTVAACGKKGGPFPPEGEPDELGMHFPPKEDDKSQEAVEGF